MEFLINIGSFFTLLIIGYGFGKLNEKKHYKSIREREKQFSYIITNSLKSTYIDENKISESKMVYGSVVVSLDYFKRILASLVNITGGRVISYESLLDRAKREAMCRMKDQARDFQMIINVRYKTTSIGGNSHEKNSVGAIELLVYGTALRVKNEAHN